MSITSYAQNFEDVMLWRALAHVDHGLYIDIGAQDPIVDSVSLAFHEHGWRGVHVEPTSHYAELLRQQRPGDMVIQAAVGDGQAVLRFFEIPGTGISTADSVIADQHRERGFDVREITVPSVPLSAVFEAVGEAEVHWLKIDVEGFEAQVLSSWGGTSLRPWIVVVESILPLSRIETHQKWEATLLSYGYASVYFDGVNRFYVSDAHPELKNAFNMPPNIFDRFALNGTASATFHSLIEVRFDRKISEAIAQVEREKNAVSHQIEHLTKDLASADEANAKREYERVQREQAIGQQLIAEQAQVRNLLEDGVKRERVLVEQTGVARQNLENVLRTLAQREQEMSAQLLAMSQQATREKAEQACQIESLLSDLAKREQEVGAQLLAWQQEAMREMAEQASEHSEQVRTLKREQAERECSLRDQLGALKQELHCLQKEQARREQEHSRRVREHVEQIRQTREALESELRCHIDREQEVTVQLLRIQQEAARETAEQVFRQAEEVRVLQREHLERVETYSEQLQAAQQALRDVTLNCAEMQRQFDRQLNVELEASQQLRGALALLKNEVETMRNAMSWRLTAPLRAVAEWFVKAAVARTDSECKDSDQLGESVSSQSTNLSAPDTEAETSCSPLSEAFSMKSHHSTLTNQLPRSSTSANLKTLLQCQDYQFVESAYLTLLKRKPDSEGGSHYLSRLRAGVSKIQILGELCASREARMMRVEIPGLRQALRWQKLGRLPVLGTVIRSVVAVEGTTAFESRLRALEHQIFLLGQQSEVRFSRLDQGMSEIKKAIESGLRVNYSTGAQQLSVSPVMVAVESVADVKQQTRSILAEAILLKAGSADDVIGQLACALANSQEAQQLA